MFLTVPLLAVLNIATATGTLTLPNGCRRAAARPHDNGRAARRAARGFARL